MRTSTLVASSAALAVASAYDFSQWSPAGPSDVRSPCPMLNALANHNILPHSGKGLTVPMLMSALGGALNIGDDLSSVLSVGGLLTSPNPLGLTLDLDDLDAHNNIEHDASLGHNDFYFGGDDHTFNQTIFDTYMAYYDGVNSTSLDIASKGRLMRVKTEAGRDPDFTYGPKQFILSYGETALILSALGDPVNGVVPADWLRIIWEQERLPWKEGWKTTSTQINGLSVNLMVARLVAASGDVLPEGLLLATNTVLRAFTGLDPITGVLSDLEKKLLGLFNISL